MTRFGDTIFPMDGNKIESLQEFVRRRMKDKDWRPQDVENKSSRRGNKIDRSYVARIVNYGDSNLSVEKLKALAKGLDISDDEIFAVARGIAPSQEPDRSILRGMGYLRELPAEAREDAISILEILWRRHSGENKGMPVLNFDNEQKKKGRRAG